MKEKESLEVVASATKIEGRVFKMANKRTSKNMGNLISTDSDVRTNGWTLPIDLKQKHRKLVKGHPRTRGISLVNRTTNKCNRINNFTFSPAR